MRATLVFLTFACRENVFIDHKAHPIRGPCCCCSFDALTLFTVFSLLFILLCVTNRILQQSYSALMALYIKDVKRTAILALRPRRGVQPNPNALHLDDGIFFIPDTPRLNSCPWDYLRPKVCVWVPEWLWYPDVGLPCCPCCGCADSVQPNAWRTRPIIALNCVYILLYRRYKCMACKERAEKGKGKAARMDIAGSGGADNGVEEDGDVVPDEGLDEAGEQAEVRWSFRGIDRAVLEMGPAFVREKFPAVITKQKGLDVLVVDEMFTRVLRSGGSLGSVRESVVEAHGLRHQRLELLYLKSQVCVVVSVIVPSSFDNFKHLCVS